MDGFTSLTYKALLPLISVFGLAGNALSVAVLSKDKFAANVTYVFLRALAWVDIAYLVCTLQVGRIALLN